MSRQTLRRSPQRFNHELKHLASVQIGIVKETMCHQVTPVGPFSEKCVKADPGPRSGKERQGRRGARKEFEIDSRIDPQSPDTPQGTQGLQDKLDEAMV